MAKDYAGRHHFFSAMLFRLIYPFWGLSMTGYVLVGILFHVLNTFLLFFFCRLLGSTAFAALAATLLFLTSSLCWGSVSNALDGLIRHPGLTFYLLAIMTAWHACAKNRPVFFFLSFSFFLTGVLTLEDTVTFPALLVLFFFLMPNGVSAPTKTGLLLLLALCSLVAFAAIMSLHQGGTTRYYDLFYGWHSLQKLLTLPREVFQFLFVPRREWGLSKVLALRTLAAALIFLPLCWLFFTASQEGQKRWRARNKTLFVLAFAWVAVTILPALAKPSGWTWYSRYLYYASVGIFMLCGACAERCCGRLMEIFSLRACGKAVAVALLGYCMTFGIFTTILLWKEFCLNTTAFFPVGPVESRVFFGLISHLHTLPRRDANTQYLLLSETPLAPARIQSMLDHYILPNIKVISHRNEVPEGPVAIDALAYRNGEWVKTQATTL